MLWPTISAFRGLRSCSNFRAIRCAAQPDLAKSSIEACSASGTVDPATTPVNQTVLTALQYYGAGAAALAALMVSLDLGRKWTGAGFVIFVTSSLALIGWGFLAENSEGIGVQNVILLVINCVGVYRYLISKHRGETSN
jgi:hypothetical protein